MEVVRVGIIGFGNMGTIHAEAFGKGNVPRATLGAICDIDPERIEEAKKLYPDTPMFSNATEMMKSGKVDAIVIAIPHYFHPPVAIEAFGLGLHVLTEKPAGVYTKQVLEMNEAAKKSGKTFGIMYQVRTLAVYQKLRDMIRRGELGNIKRVNWTITNWYRPQAYHDSATWRSTWKDEGGGTLINQNPHQLDMWQWLFGMPSRIMAHASFGKYYNIETEDEVTAYMEYDNGMTGTYITSTGEWPGTNRLEIACDMGRVVVENGEITFNRNIMSEREFNAQNSEPFGMIENWTCKIPVDTSKEEHHIGIFKSFINGIFEGTPLIAPGEEGVLGLTISNAMHYSAWTGKWADVKNFPHDEFYELLQEKIKNSTYVKKTVKKLAGDMSNSFNH